MILDRVEKTDDGWCKFSENDEEEDKIASKGNEGGGGGENTCREDVPGTADDDEAC